MILFIGYGLFSSSAGLKNSSTLNDLKENCYYCYYKKNVDNASGTIANKPDCPCNNQDYGDEI